MPLQVLSKFLFQSFGGANERKRKKGAGAEHSGAVEMAPGASADEPPAESNCQQQSDNPPT
jgi:hypothetical protein